ncbi:MAG: hypothetical protein DHS20C19_28880 [Acidimicrobiales bacterium]|nr:MAG: hypothetical protein DHS20C19_28880 [Acidimicrobiales bacterium]
MVAQHEAPEEYGTIERSIQIDASPETVFEVVTRPEHLEQWWPDEARVEPAAGATGQLVFGDPSTGDATIPNITILSLEPPARFTFRWTHPDDAEAGEDNSLLVVFELAPSGDGTQLRMTETGFREQGWEVAVLEENLRLHEEGWDRHLARLVHYAPTVRMPT